MITPRSAGLGLAATLLLALTACGTETPASTTTQATHEVSEDATIVSCGGEAPGWPVSAMSSGITSHVETWDLAHALEALVSEAGIEAPQALQDAPIEDAPWLVLAETNDTVIVATGAWDENGPGDGSQVVTLERGADGWRASGWGGCSNLGPVLEPGHQWVQVNLDPDTDIDPASTEVPVAVSETMCTSGRDPGPFLHEPRIVESHDSVTVYWTSDAPDLVGEDGNEIGYTCIGNVPVAQTLHLDEPLGDRTLSDGSRWPTRPVAAED